MNAESRVFRYVILALASVCTFGTCLSMDVLVAVQVLLTRSPNCTVAMLADGIDCCQDCLGLGDFKYNTMFSIIFVTSILSLAGVGLLLDKLGNSVIVITAIIAFAGNSIIALGSTISHSAFFLPCMFVGSGFLGFGYLSSVTCRDRIVLTWFMSKEMGVAMGIVTALNRLASLGVFSLTEKIRESIGLQWTLWVMASLSLLALLSSVCVSAMDFWGMRQLNLSESVKEEQKSVKVSDALKFGAKFWLLVWISGFLMTGEYLMFHNAIEYVYENGDFTKQMASIIGGSVRYSGLIAGPVGGILADMTNQPQICMFVVGFLLVFAFALMAFTPIHLAVTVPLIGGLNSGQLVIVLSALSHSVPKVNFGMALSLFIGVLAAMTAVFHFIVGSILGSEKRVALPIKLARWRVVMTVIFGLFVISACLTVIYWIVSVRQKSTASDEDEAKYQKLETESDADDVDEK